MVHIYFIKSLMCKALVLTIVSMVSHNLLAAEVTLKFQHFLSVKSTTHLEVVVPWAEAVEEQSGGRIKVHIFPAMQLGGKPPQLINQVRDGVVDLVWTLPGYTAGRYPVISAFELPFMVTNAEQTSQALQEYYEKHGREEFKDVHPVFFHVHDRGSIHTIKKSIQSVADFKNQKLRAPNRQIGNTLKAFGASPIFMPVPAVPSALSKGVVDGAVIPWEVTVPLKVAELTSHHAEVKTERGLYTATFIVAMNKDKYNSLPDDLKQVIDNNSGVQWSKRSGIAFDKAEELGIAIAKKRGNLIVTIPELEVASMKKISQSVVDDWIQKTPNGSSLFTSANNLLEKYSQ